MRFELTVEDVSNIQKAVELAIRHADSSTQAAITLLPVLQKLAQPIVEEKSEDKS